LAQARAHRLSCRALSRLRLGTIMRVGAAIAVLACRLSAAKELTKETWDDAVAGKTVFVKFQAPW